MNDNRKAKEQLIQELKDLHRRIAELEKLEVPLRRTAGYPSAIECASRGL